MYEVVRSDLVMGVLGDADGIFGCGLWVASEETI